MSAPPPPPPGYGLVTPEPPRRRTWLRWLVVAVAVAVLVAGATFTAVLLLDGDDDKQAAYPDQWAAEVFPYVAIVEAKRDLKFRHPVYVEFLSDDEFREQVTADEEDLTDEDRKELEQAAGLFRATGLLEGDVDLFEAQNELSGAGVIGYYSFDDETIRMRGKKLTPASKSTLVHELTHALQDQHFDLGERYDSFGESEGTAESVFRAVVEGDASRIETAYAEDLSANQREKLREAQQAEAKEARKKIKDLPKVLTTLMAAPYNLGEALLQLALQLDDNDAVNELFLDPPVNEEHLLDPWTLLEDDDRAIAVAKPQLKEGEEEFDTGEFGALTWFIVLAERLTILEALDAADGWGGDQYVAFERDGTSCVRVGYRAESDADLTQMERSLRRWIATLPGSPASVRIDDGKLEFVSCDPGTGTDVGRDTSDQALGLALSRTYLSITFLKETGNDRDISRCLGNRFAHAFTVKQLNDEKLAADPVFQARVQEVARSCA